MFVYRPHVQGRESTTTPDLIVDRLVESGRPLDPALLTTATELRVGERLGPSIVLVAAQYGPLVAPACRTTAGLRIVSREAWRVADLADHLDDVLLAVRKDGSAAHDVRLSQLPIAAALSALERGVACLLEAGGLELSLDLDVGCEFTLTDARLARAIRHTVHAARPPRANGSTPGTEG